MPIHKSPECLVLNVDIAFGWTDESQPGRTAEEAWTAGLAMEIVSVGHWGRCTSKQGQESQGVARLCREIRLGEKFKVGGRDRKSILKW